MEFKVRGNSVAQNQTDQKSPGVCCATQVLPEHRQNTGRFPLATNDIPETPLHYLADQLEITVDQIHEYDWLGRSGTRHRKEILEFLGIRRVSAA
ncbi:DUF4158 domain-containing protein, partial [Thiolapillus sp.]|uniref:DUF4158 domain-containing protein n=1 Tax=Thiolapillus sp. TaxID=2017437 RepID=UPI003AF6CDCB